MSAGRPEQPRLMASAMNATPATVMRVLRMRVFLDGSRFLPSHVAARRAARAEQAPSDLSDARRPLLHKISAAMQDPTDPLSPLGRKLLKLDPDAYSQLVPTAGRGNPAARDVLENTQPADLVVA